ncbi:MAG TPA: aminomethyltransferase family protein [Gemmataceae bacterium]|nr:aminomethyltransferase family protein [Gemmataceae bacterium]
MPERTPLYQVEKQAGAVFAEEAGWLMPAHFGDPAAEYRHATEGAAVFDLSHRGKVVVTGPDARTFLNNLSTNDIKGLTPGAGCETFLCNVQARVVASPVVYCSWPPEGSSESDGSDVFWLDLDAGTADKVIKHLDHHLISEQVELRDSTRACVQLHLAGPEAQAILARALFVEVKLQELRHSGLCFSGGLLHVRRRSALGLPGYDLLYECERASKLWQALAEAGARPAGSQVYEVLRVEAGTPAYGKDIDESVLAPEVGRTAQAISYTKGCYLGQEPICRIRDLGHVNRTLLGLRITGTEAVPPGAKLFRDGKEVGHVTSSVVSPRWGAIALAYVRRGHEPGTVVEVEAAGTRRTARVTGLPFSSGNVGGTG